MISIESTPATAPRESTTGPYCASCWSRSESASRSTSSSSTIGLGARAEVVLHPLAGECPLDEPPERPALGVHQQRVREVRVRHLRARLGHRLAHSHQGRPPQVDVPHALKRQPLERPVGAHEVLHEAAVRMHQQLRGGRVLGELPALLEHGDAVAHLDRLVDVVGDEDDGLADLLLEPQELVLQALAVDRVDGAEGLVHEHQRRIGRQGAGHAHPLPLAAGQLAGIARAGLRRVEAHQLEQLVHARRDALLRPAQQVRDGGDVVGRGEVGEEADLLDRVADLAAQVGRPALA